MMLPRRIDKNVNFSQMTAESSNVLECR